MHFKKFPWFFSALTETISSGLSLGSSGFGASVGNVSPRALRASREKEAPWGENTLFMISKSDSFFLFYSVSSLPHLIMFGFCVYFITQSSFKWKLSSSLLHLCFLISRGSTTHSYRGNCFLRQSKKTLDTWPHIIMRYSLKTAGKMFHLMTNSSSSENNCFK